VACAKKEKVVKVREEVKADDQRRDCGEMVPTLVKASATRRGGTEGVVQNLKRVVATCGSVARCWRRHETFEKGLSPTGWPRKRMPPRTREDCPLRRARAEDN
jgi:hypothetical protein